MFKTIMGILLVIACLVALVFIYRQARKLLKTQAAREQMDKITRSVIVYTFLVFVAFIILIPFYWMFNVSLQDTAEVGQLEVSLYPGQLLGGFNPRWRNFTAVFNISSFNITRYIGNTIIVGFFSTVGTIITTVLASFAFARLNFKGREILFAIFLATMMIPGEMFVISNFVTIFNFGWYDTKYALIFPFIVSTYYIYLLRQTFKQIPNELYYAAKVDGTGDFGYLVRVMLPIALPTIITISILKMMGTWNSYIWPRLVTETNGTQRLITEALRTEKFDYRYNELGELVKGLPSGETRANTTIQMAATTVVTLPLLLLFIFARKYIMRGVSRSGIKG